MQDEEKKFSFQIFKDLLVNSRRIIGIMWQEHKKLLLTIEALFLVLGATPFAISGAQGILINELVRSFGAGVVNTYLIGAIALLIGVGLFSGIAATVQKYFDRAFWFAIQEKFELLFLKKRGELDIAHYEDRAHNDLFQKVNENGIWRIHTFTERQLYLFQSIFEVAIAAIILFFASWWILVILFLGTLPEMVIEGVYGRKVWNIYQGRAETRRRYIDLTSYFEQLPKIVELRLFQNVGYFFESIKKLLRGFYSEELKNERKKMGKELASFLLSQAVIAFAIIWLVLEVVHGNMQIGALTFYLASIADFRRSLSGFFLGLGRQYQDSLFVTDAFKMLDLPAVIERKKLSVPIATSETPEIVFDKVSFSYPATSRAVLKDFSLTIKPGEKIALIGVNGAGKTTLIKLLCRFYDPTKGRILIGGIDLKEIDLEVWYSMLGILFQDYANYHFLVKEAIGVGRTSKVPSFEKVKEAARASEAEMFIEEWDSAYEQMLGKEFSGGVEPSIGQWQKLGLARTFYRDPRVLILDEPTSSIDAESEAKIFEKLEELPQDRTVILISHRFSTVRQANRIVVIDGGRLKEVGTHNELLKQEGIYSRLFKLQAKGYR